MSDSIEVFNRRKVRLHRERAVSGLRDHDFLFREVAERMVERIDDVRRSFPVALDLGCHGGELRDALGGRGGIECLIEADPSPGMVGLTRPEGGRLVCEADQLPLAAESLDLVLSNLSLHWVNDLPGALVQIRRALRPDGLFLAAILGGETLHELRTSLTEAELHEEGGVSPRVSPFVDVRDAGALLQRAGFALPVVDQDLITVSYPDPFKLMRDLRGMGEANAVAAARPTFTRRATLMRAAGIYGERFAGEDGRVTATFHVLYLTGWSPHESQQKPLRPGSAEHRLADALGSKELPAGDPVGPVPGAGAPRKPGKTD